MNILNLRNGRGVAKTVMVCCCVLAISACNRTMPPEELLADARAAIARNDFQAASIQLKNALQQDANNAAARFELGKVHVKLGDNASAVKELRWALDLGYDQGETVPLLVRAMVDSDDSTSAISGFSSLTMPTPAAEADLKAALGYAYLATRNNEAAARAFDDALRIDNGHAYASLGKARLLAVQQDLEGSRALLGKVIASDPTDPAAWFLDAELKAAQGKMDEALVSYRKVYEIKPDSLRARFIVISTLADRNRLEEARAELALMRKVNPKSPEANYLDGLLLVKERKFPQARQALNKVLALAPDFPPALSLAAFTEFELQSFTTAEQHGEKALAANGDSLFLRKVLIGSYLKTGRVAKAQQTLEPLLQKFPDNPEVQAIAGQVALTAGDVKAAEGAFAKAANLKPDDAAAQSRLGLSRLAAGDRSGGISALESAVRLDTDDTHADILLIVAHFRDRDPDRALAAIDVLEKKKPGDPMTANLRGTAYLLKEDAGKARANFMKALEIDPTFFPAASNLARMDLIAGKPADAEGRFRAVLAKSPQHADALLALAGLKAREKEGVQEAIALLQKAQQAHPKLLAPWAALVQLYTALGDKNQALSVAGNAASAMPENLQVMELLASSQAVAGEVDAAVATRSKMVALEPSNPKFLLRLAAAQMLIKRESEAIQNVRKALSLDPRMLEAQQMLMAIHISRKALDDALKIARDVQTQQPKAAVGFAMEGELQMLAGKPEAAVVAYRQAIARERDASNVVKLHAALSRSGKDQEAKALVDDWVKDKPADIAVPLYLAERSLALKRYDEAFVRYQALLVRAPKDVVVLNNLAWLSAQRKDGKALDYAEKAYAASPGNPAVLDTYGAILFDGGEHERGLTMMRQAVAGAPGAHELRLNLAQHLAKAGLKAEARKELEPLVALGSKFGRAAEVSELMKNL